MVIVQLVRNSKNDDDTNPLVSFLKDVEDQLEMLLTTFVESQY